MGHGKSQNEPTDPWNLVRDSEGNFGDPNHVAGENYFIESEGEQRYQVIGMTKGLVLLLVVFVDRGDQDTEVIHLIGTKGC